jgi:hypothetical protein
MPRIGLGALLALGALHAAAAHHGAVDQARRQPQVVTHLHVEHVAVLQVEVDAPAEHGEALGVGVTVGSIGRVPAIAPAVHLVRHGAQLLEALYLPAGYAVQGG